MEAAGIEDMELDQSDMTWLSDMELVMDAPPPFTSEDELKARNLLGVAAHSALSNDKLAGLLAHQTHIELSSQQDLKAITLENGSFSPALFVHDIDSTESGAGEAFGFGGGGSGEVEMIGQQWVLVRHAHHAPRTKAAPGFKGKMVTLIHECSEQQAKDVPMGPHRRKMSVIGCDGRDSSGAIHKVTGLLGHCSIVQLYTEAEMQFTHRWSMPDVAAAPSANFTVAAAVQFDSGIISDGPQLRHIPSYPTAALNCDTLRVQGDAWVGGALHTNKADWAEWMPKRDPEEELSAGDVVEVKDGMISREITYEGTLFVVSTDPGVAAADPGKRCCTECALMY